MVCLKMMVTVWCVGDETWKGIIKVKKIEKGSKAAKVDVEKAESSSSSTVRV